jgi:acetylornithine deacetylase/succinyl-diaminopimelate desuccinylase-like protein
VSDQQIEWEQIKQEASFLLSEYIKVNTVNPPGNEMEGALFLRDILVKEGFEVDIIESVSGRGNLVTRLKGSGEASPLYLLHHIDVVPVEEDKWEYPPFSGFIKDGEIWGRGALDCKSLGIMELMALVILKREGFKPRRNVILLATADEEAGGKWGIEWMIKNRPELFRGGAVINEGGGPGLTTRKGRIFFCQTAEKGVCWLRLICKGVPGHASIPHGHNCVVQMAQVIDRISRFHPPFQKSEVVEKLIRRVASEQEIMDPPEFLKLLSPEDHDKALEKVPEENFRNLLNALLHNTFVPTVVKGGSKSNVIPSECYCEIDCRMLPGSKPEDILSIVKDLTREFRGLEIEVIDSSIPSQSPLDHELYHLLGRAMKRYDPQAELVPYMSTGASDSRYFREMGMIAYGVQMDISPGAWERMHGHNERISTGSLLFGIQVFHGVIREFCG